MMNVYTRLAVLLAIGCSLASPAWALFEDKDARLAIIELRKQVERLSKESQAGSDDNEQLRRALLDLQSQVDDLKAELARVKGGQDALAKDLSDTQRAIKDQAQGIEQRLRKFEPIKVSIDGKEAEVDPAEAKEYEQALSVFRKGDFSGAASSFGDFVRRYSQSPYLSLSLFWLGNAQYATKDYKSAIASFRQLINGSPDHPRVPEAMLAIANCQLEIKEPAAARKTLGELIKTYPTTEAASAAKERLSKLK
jgi:tol-pal system protein YbgF